MARREKWENLKSLLVERPKKKKDSEKIETNLCPQFDWKSILVVHWRGISETAQRSDFSLSRTQEEYLSHLNHQPIIRPLEPHWIIESPLGSAPKTDNEEYSRNLSVSPFLLGFTARFVKHIQKPPKRFSPPRLLQAVEAAIARLPQQMDSEKPRSYLPKMLCVTVSGLRYHWKSMVHDTEHRTISSL